MRMPLWDLSEKGYSCRSMAVRLESVVFSAIVFLLANMQPNTAPDRALFIHKPVPAHLSTPHANASIPYRRLSEPIPF